MIQGEDGSKGLLGMLGPEHWGPRAWQRFLGPTQGRRAESYLISLMQT